MTPQIIPLRKVMARDAFIEQIYTKIKSNYFTCSALRRICTGYLEDHYIDLKPEERQEVIDMIIDHHRSMQY